MIQIENKKEGFELLWRQLESTRQMLARQGKRFCLRNVLRSWFPAGIQPRQDLSWNDFVWEVCRGCDLLGLDLLPPPSLHPHPHREMLRALTQVSLNIGRHHVKLRELDAAYSTVFPDSTPLNVSKKRITSPAA